MTLRHITFIRPHIRDMRASDAMEPLAFAVLSARTPEHIERAFYDERIERVPLDLDTGLVAISVETFTARRAYQIAAAYRRRGVPVIMGGYHPTLLPEEAGRHCDAVCIGDAEGAWERLLADADQGQLQKRYKQERPPSLDEGPPPDRSIFAGKRYGMMLPLQFGRGCRYNCDFCSIRAFYGTSVRHRSIETVLAEIPQREQAAQKRVLAIVDDNLFTRPEAAAELCDALEPLGWPWACQTSIEVAHDRAMLRKMAASGCVAVMIGFESLDPANLAAMNKRWNLGAGEYSQAIANLHEHGIMIYGSFVFGYDQDTPEVFAQTLRFAIGNRLTLANFNLLTPTPGTPLIDRLRAEGRLLHPEWWLDPEYRYGEPAFRPARMSPEQLRDGCDWARRRFYSFRSVLGRGLATPRLLRQPARLALFAGANWVAGREVRRKQQSSFGEPEVPVASSGVEWSGWPGEGKVRIGRQK